MRGSGGWFVAYDGYGRDTRYRARPAQIRTSGITAYGSCLGLWREALVRVRMAGTDFGDVSGDNAGEAVPRHAATLAAAPTRTKVTPNSFRLAPASSASAINRPSESCPTTLPPTNTSVAFPISFRPE